MNEKIAKALAEDIKRRSSKGGTFEFHDDDAVYTVSVRVERMLSKSLRESKGLRMSGGAAGASCGCCNGTGRA